MLGQSNQIVSGKLRRARGTGNMEGKEHSVDLQALEVADDGALSDPVALH